MAHENKDGCLRYFLRLLEKQKAESVLKVKAYFQ